MFREDLAPDIHLFKIEAPAVARKAQPGQFVIIMVDEKGERIPLTIADWDREEGSVTVVFVEVGTSTHKLAQLKAGDAIVTFTGPLGLPAEVDRFGTLVCVAATYGVATIVPIARALREAGNRVIIIVRAPDNNLLFQGDRLRSASDELIATTDDGSSGRQDFVIEPLRELLQSGEKIDRVIVMASTCIMRYCAEMTRPFKIKTIVSLTPIMVDGTGMCGTCRVSVGGETKFACVDGPEFDGHEVDWNLLMARRCTCCGQRQPWWRGSFGV